MSATLVRPDAASYDGVAPPTHAPPPPRRPATGEPFMPIAIARGIAFGALAAWGSLHWMALLEPAEPQRGWLLVVVALIAAGAMLAAGRLEGRSRVIAAVAALVPLTALVFLAGRVADELLLPGGWSELAGGISRGVSDLPGVRVPYRGLDDWVRTVIPLGGSALVVLAAVLAFWPRRKRLGWPALALLVLTAVYVVPIVAMDLQGEFIRGAAFTLLMVAFLRLEKLRRPDTAAAAAIAVAATAVALIAAPALNRDTPWFDYETWALETSASKSTTFTWSHNYDILDWPRDGRELLRVRAEQPAYWKAENLDMYDGKRWVRSQVSYGVPEFPDDEKVLRNWSQELRISIRNLRTDTYITAGYAFDVDIPRLNNVPTMDGLVLPPRTLRRGDSYRAEVYTPKPSESQRRRAGSDYDGLLNAYTTIYTTIVGIPGAEHVRMTFPFFGDEDGVPELGPPQNHTLEMQLAQGGLTRSYALAQRLADGARTPEDYVQRVLGYLGSDQFGYSETPPPEARTLEGFLFDARQGYCQQFSGAMALLLRMGGVPARVVTGFSTGATDTKTGEYVVRDFDAHSWVEAYYPGWGWITFDPTPGASPARSQPADATSTGSSSAGSAPRFGADPLSERGAGIPIADESAPWWRWPLWILGGLALGALIAAAIRRWRRGAPPALFELERALRRTRHVPAPGTTLQALESRFAATPAAAGYVRALRESRYRDQPGHPTRAQRRGLRTELGRGAGLLGRVRAWWALPPR
jgi:transglutaminase-like putative cysteine protease